MAVTDIVFIFTFLPLSLALYYLVKKNYREYILLFVSLLFYACGSPEYFSLLLLSLIVNLSFGWLIGNCKGAQRLRICWLILGIVYDFSILGYYKYRDFVLLTVGRIAHFEVTMSNLILPLGLSSFVFKAVSYLVDVYCGKIEVKKNPVQAALYLSFFAQIQSGPISRAEDMQPVKNFSTFNNLADGLFRFMIGFEKKILIADTLSNITKETFAALPQNMSGAYAWLGAVCYSLQLLFDFSGYSDMAIGMSKMFGYKCPENFNYPYMAESVSKFWRRWHITLGAWFRDYVYIPLGGSRVNSKFRLYLNLLIVWAFTGIWHGSSWRFVFWGLAYFVLIAFEKSTCLPDKLKTKAGKCLYRVLTLLAINFLWVIFGADGLRRGIEYIKVMVFFPANSLADFRTSFLIKDNIVFILAAIVLCFPIIPRLANKFKRGRVTYFIGNFLLVTINSMLFIWAVSYVVAGQNNPFAYANF